MIFPWRFKIFPHQKTPGSHHPPTELLPLFAGSSSDCQSSVFNNLPRKLTSSTAEAAGTCPPFGNARFVEIPGWFGENKKVVFFRRFRNGGMKTKRRTCGRWVSVSFLGSWSSRSGVWSPLLACEAPSWTNWFVERGCIFPKPVDACLVKSVDLESQDLFYEWQGFGGYGDASPLLTGTRGTPSFTRDIRPNKNPPNHSSSKSNHWFFRIYLQTYPTTSKSRNPTAVGGLRDLPSTQSKSKGTRVVSDKATAKRARCCSKSNEGFGTCKTHHRRPEGDVAKEVTSMEKLSLVGSKETLRIIFIYIIYIYTSSWSMTIKGVYLQIEIEYTFQFSSGPTTSKPPLWDRHHCCSKM